MPRFNTRKTVGIAMCAALLSTAPGLAQLTATSKNVPAVVRQERAPGLQRIPDCDEVGLCNERQRLLFPSTNERALERLQQRGCTVEHRFEDSVSLSCPRGLGVNGARTEKVFRAQDVESNEQIFTQAGWDAGATGANVRVAVLDTGVQANHVELDGRVAAMKNFTDDSFGDAIGHGTHVAGTIAGKGTKTIDGTAAIGVAPQASLYVAKVCNNDGWCLEGDVMAGMEWAEEVNANVVNMSLGGGSYGSHCDGIALADKANWLTEQGIVVVAAAGNNGAGVGVPACASKAIAVGAVDADDERATWSSYGDALDVMAPGVGIFSTYSCLAAGSCPGDWYARMSGTSMAAPHVAGAAALLLEAYPALTVSEVYGLLTVTADDLGEPDKDVYYGYGRINIGKAFALAEEMFGVDEEEAEEEMAEEDECPDEDGDGFTVCNGDCNDADPLINPRAVEFCNGKDDDCNSLSDDQCIIDGFCGDRVCQERENANHCPEDCRIKDGNNMTICGNNTCEGRENAAVCPEDCEGVRGSGTANDAIQNTPAAGPAANGRSKAPSNAGRGGGRGNGGGRP